MDNPDHILIVDDDREIRELAGNFLKKNGLNVTLAADGRTLTRRDSWRSLPARDASLQAEVEGKLRTGGLVHTVLAGVETWRLTAAQDIRYSSLTSQPFAIDIYNPVYDQPVGNLTPGFDLVDRTRATGVFVQDQIDLSAK